MYETLIHHLRECAKADPSENTFTEAADAIEELLSIIPHNCFCCVGCELEPADGRGCKYGFVPSAKRAKQYIDNINDKIGG